MYLKAAFTLFLSAAQVSAFFVTPNGVMKRPFVPLKVSLSDPSSGTEVEGSEEPEAIVEETTEVSTEEVTSEASPKTMKGTERYTLYVGNLPFSTNIQAVRELFSEHVDVTYVSLPTNRATGTIKGFAFVDVATEDEIPIAVEKLNEFEMDGRPLRVSRSLPKDQIRSTKKTFEDGKKLYVGNVAFASTRNELTEYFGQYGEVIDIFLPVNNYGEPRGFAFLTVKKEDADAVVEATDGVEFMGRTLVVNEPLPPGEKAERIPRSERVKLYVGNLSFYTTGETLSEVFQEFGTVHDCYIPTDIENGNSRGFGFISLDKEAAEAAIDALDGCELDGRMITVNEAKPRGPRGAPEVVDEDSDSDDSEAP